MSKKKIKVKPCYVSKDDVAVEINADDVEINADDVDDDSTGIIIGKSVKSPTSNVVENPVVVSKLWKLLDNENAGGVRIETSAMVVSGRGCLLRVTSIGCGFVSSSLEYIPSVRIQTVREGGEVIHRLI